MDKNAIIIILIAAFFLILFLILSKPKRNNNSKVYVKKIKFKSDPTLSTEKDFINYLHEYAIQDNISEKKIHEIKKYFDLNFEYIMFGYILTTGNALTITDEQALLEEEIKSYEDRNDY